MNFFAGFSLPSQAILENVGQEARLKDAEKGAESAGLKYWDRLIGRVNFLDALERFPPIRFRLQNHTN
jgi:hypothetical protein